jgi:type IV pilus assembly protein PilB
MPSTTSTDAAQLELVGFLKNVNLFADLPDDSLAKLGACLKMTEFPPSETIMREGAPGVSMYVIKQGVVEVRKKDPSTGIDFLVAQLGPGAAVGEMSLLTGKPRSASVGTVEPTTVYSLTRADFRNLLTQYPEISLGLARILAERLEEANKQVGVAFVSLTKNISFDPRVVGLIPHNILAQHKVVPIAYHNNSLTIAMVNPSNLVAFDDVRRYVQGVIIEPRVCTEEEFNRFMSLEYPKLMNIQPAKGRERTDKEKERARREEERKRQQKKKDKSVWINATIQSLEDLEAEILSGIELQQDEEEKPNEPDLQTASSDAPIVRLANNILALAIQKGASDIHIEPQEHGVRLRLRIDGILRVESILSKKIMLPLASRLKILSRLDISERRLPQDGRISIKIDDRAIDFRVSTVPAKFGEKIVMRVLDKSASLMPLDKIIDHPATMNKVRNMIKEPYGIVYVTGPTGSGKTTSLYSALGEINHPGTNISTAEDPIEYDLAGVNQIQTHKDIGLDFARILRAFLRQDPDVILIGETRDRETAKIAIEAALTGHLVFTTLHTNDAPGAFTRLEDMGVEAFLMASSTIGIMAQRLARRICTGCKEGYTPEPAVAAFFGFNDEDNLPTFYRGTGCDECGGLGYKGRVGVYEVLVMNEELRRLVASGAKTAEVRDCAVKKGMMTLQGYASFLLTEGLTTAEAVTAVVSVSD